MRYAVKEIFYTLQGEGINAGRPAVFLRFAGCNLWSGRETERTSAICQFCDTDFVGTDGSGGGKFASPEELATAVRHTWPAPVRSAECGWRSESSGPSPARPLVVCTGGEPLLQLDEPLVLALQQVGFETAIETNGTRLPPPGIDWICVSPKAGADLILRHGQELKLIYPQAGIDPADFLALDFEHFLLQPMDGPDRERNTQLALRYCLEHPRWRLSLQTHKLLGIP